VRTLLSLDLGVTTGFAVLDVNPPEDEYGVIEHGVITLSALEHELHRIMLNHMPRLSVAEKPLIVRGKLGDQLQSTISITERVLYHQVQMWTPSQWKSHPLAKNPLPRGLTPHERDAIRLGFVYRARVVENLVNDH